MRSLNQMTVSIWPKPTSNCAEGTLMNKEQKGRSDLKLASLRRDRALVELAREAAYEIVDPDITLSKQSEIRAELSMFLRPEDEEFLFKS